MVLFYMIILFRGEKRKLKEKDSVILNGRQKRVGVLRQNL